jgi:DNA-binding transcriptional LysR family regulator
MPYPTVFLRPRRKRDFVSIGQAAKRGFGLAGAGKHLGVNHSTVSRRLGQIEQHLGTRLFERGRARYRLTPCGVEMVSLAERMFQEIIGFERRASGQDMRPSGELRVTTSDVLLRHLLSAVLVTFRRAYPEITLDIVVSNQRLDLRKRDADVAVRATYDSPEPLTGTNIARVGWAVFGAASLADEPFDPVRDGGRSDWLAFAGGLSIAPVTKWLQEHVGKTRIVYKANTIVGLGEAAAGGVGLVLLPCYIGVTVPGLAQLTPPLPDLDSDLWLITHRDLRNNTRVRTFVDFCADEVARWRNTLEGTAPAGPVR